MKILYIANETKIGDQVGPRYTLKKLYEEKNISQYEIISFINLKLEVGEDKTNDHIIKTYSQSMFDKVLIEHIGEFNLRPDTLIKIKTMNPDVKIIYREDDIYKGVAKPITKRMKAIAPYIDYTFVCGDGEYLKYFSKSGFKNVIYSPNCVDLVRFGKSLNLKKENEIIFIGSNVGRRLKLFEMEGNRERREFITALSEKYEKKFALYGQGWDKLKSSRGTLHFDLQEQEIKKSKLVIGIDHYPSVLNYFSNRLPIAMVTKVPYVSYKGNGLDKLFKEGKEIFFYENKDELMHIVEKVLNMSQDERDEIGENAYKKIIKYYTTYPVYKKMLDMSK